MHVPCLVFNKCWQKELAHDLWLNAVSKKYKAEYDHKFEVMDDGRTRLIFVVQAQGFGVSLWGRLFAAVYSRNLDTAIPNLIAEMNALSG